MAIGRTFKESLQKALRGLGSRQLGFGCDNKDLWGTPRAADDGRDPRKLCSPDDDRVWYLRYAMKIGMIDEQIHEMTGTSIRGSSTTCSRSSRLKTSFAPARGTEPRSPMPCFAAPSEHGFSDAQLAFRCGAPAQMAVRSRSQRLGIVATFKSVDTCAAEFEAYTPYYYSTYEDEDETRRSSRVKKRIMILGGGPNRIGQGIEFDYCCCHASFALQGAWASSRSWSTRTPRRSSTDYDTSDMLFFEPLTTRRRAQHLRSRAARRRDRAVRRADAAEPGAALSSMPACRSSAPASTRSKRPRTARSFSSCSTSSDLQQPPNGIARTMDEAARAPAKIGYPGPGAAELRAGRPGDGDLSTTRRSSSVRGRSV